MFALNVFDEGDLVYLQFLAFGLLEWALNPTDPSHKSWGGFYMYLYVFYVHLPWLGFMNLFKYILSKTHIWILLPEEKKMTFFSVLPKPFVGLAVSFIFLKFPLASLPSALCNGQQMCPLATVLHCQQMCPLAFVSLRSLRVPAPSPLSSTFAG